jgi:hypothetical protein
MLNRVFVAAALLLAVVAAAPRLDFIETSFYIIDEERVTPEDSYVTAEAGRVEGVVDGDLTIGVYGDLVISGTVAGDVTVASGGTVWVTETGLVEGALRGVARRVVVDGRVDDDVAVAALSTRVSGVVGRDAVGIGGSVTIDGEVGRDAKGWFFNGDLSGIVGNDVDMRLRRLDIGGGTRVGGDLLYRADRNADVGGEINVEGTFAKLPTRSPFAVRILLTIFTILGLVAFLLVGLVVLWLSRSTAPLAAGAVVTRPWQVLGAGVAVVLGGPLLMWGIVTLIQPFLAKLAVVAVFAVLAVIAVIFGPIPSLTALGDWVTRHRGGLFGGFVVGVVAWRLVAWLLPFVGLVVSLGLLIWGVGGWIVAIWDRRSRHAPAQLLPPPAEAGA